MKELTVNEQNSVSGGYSSITIADKDGTILHFEDHNDFLVVGLQKSNGDDLTAILSALNDHTLSIEFSDGLTLNIPLSWDQNGAPIPLDFDFDIDSQLSNH